MKLLSLVPWLLTAFAVAAIGGLATGRSVQTWYPTLNKPSWNPPSWVFGPVWTTLYVLMAVAAWLVWQTDSSAKTLAISLWILQLLLNGLWSWLFFGWHRIGSAAVEVFVLWITILLTAVVFARASTLAGVLMLPYVLWVGFASFLNYTIWRMNAAG